MPKLSDAAKAEILQKIEETEYGTVSVEVRGNDDRVKITVAESFVVSNALPPAPGMRTGPGKIIRVARQG